MKSNCEKNGLYERLVKVIDYPSARTVGLGAAPKITISNARVEDNSFWSERDGRVVNNWRVNGAFMRLAANDAKNINEFDKLILKATGFQGLDDRWYNDGGYEQYVKIEKHHYHVKIHTSKGYRVGKVYLCLL